MYRINSINSVNNYVAPNKVSFKANGNATNPQVDQLQDVKPDFAVKTPIAYTKTGEINFPYDTKAYCYKLANGQKVIIVPQDGETVVRSYVSTGSMNEPDNLRGISHYIEHNLFNGSVGMENGEFFQNVEKMGASTNASTGFAETNYYISSNLLNSTDLENKIKMHASMLETPLFAVNKLEKEKGIVNSEINMITSKPENLAVNKMLKNLYGIKSTSTDLIGGTTDNITNLTRKDVVDYFENNYYPANMVTVVTGDVKPDETIQLISKYFTSRKQPQTNRHFEQFNPIQKSVREDIISDKATSTDIVVGFNGPASDNTKDKIYMSALSKLLTNSPTSRIYSKIKELNASADSHQEKISSNPKDGRAVIFFADSNENNSEKVLKTIFNEINNIKNNPPTEKEMQIIKKSMLKGFYSDFENSFATNDSIGTSILENDIGQLNNYEQIVNSMTAQDLVETAKKYLDVNKASVTVVHPQSATKETITQNYKNVSFTGNSAKVAINPDNVKEFNTQNNYRVITQNSKTNNVRVLYKVCTDRDIPAKPATAIILSDLLNEGTINKSQNEFDTELAQDGINKGFSANERSIVCSLGCDIDTLNKGFGSLKDVIDNPRFTQNELDLTKERIRNSILTSDKSAFDKLDSEIFKGLPEGYSKEDILKSLDEITLDDVKGLYNQILQNGKGIIAVSAPFNRISGIDNKVFSNIMNLPKVKTFAPAQLQDTFKPIEETKVLTDVDYKNQADIVEAFKFKVNNNLKDDVALELMNIILGKTSSSRLFMDLREKEKLAYHVRSNYNTNDDIGTFTLKIGTTTENKETGEQSFDNVKKSIEGFNRNIDRMKTEKVSEEELNNAKLYFKNHILNDNHSYGGRNANLVLGVNSPYGALIDNKIFEEIDKITVDDIYNCANYVFSNKPTYSILATENTINANKEYLDSLTEKKHN